eukprot:3935833-Rhodomonas_salina.2
MERMSTCTTSGKWLTRPPAMPPNAREYVHGGSGPLTDADILAIASADTPEINVAKKCLPIESPSMEDSSWQDTFGHGECRLSIRTNALWCWSRG